MKSIDRLVLTIPLPPSVNHIWRTGNGRHYRSEKYVKFAQAVGWAVIEAGRPRLGTARLEVEITLFPATRATQDIDNRIKATLDALMHAGVFQDDSQVDVLIVNRGPLRKGGAAEIRIGLLGD